MQDAGQGFKTSDPRMVGQVTSWPCGLALASAWNGDLVEEWASAVADEYKVKGSNVVLGPGNFEPRLYLFFSVLKGL